MKVQEQAKPNLPPVERGLTWRCASILSTGGGSCASTRPRASAINTRSSGVRAGGRDHRGGGARVARTLSRTSLHPRQDVRAAEVRAVLAGQTVSDETFGESTPTTCRDAGQLSVILQRAGSTPTSTHHGPAKACRRRSQRCPIIRFDLGALGRRRFRRAPTTGPGEDKEVHPVPEGHLPARRWNFPPDEEGRQRPPSGRPPRWTSGTGRCVRLTFHQLASSSAGTPTGGGRGEPPAHRVRLPFRGLRKLRDLT